MKIQWKIYLVKLKRIYSSIFEQRDIEVIRQDYYNGQWISKAELHRLFEQEKEELAKIAVTAQKDYSDLLSGFNLNAMRNYEMLEKKYQGMIKR
jgi:hypothetical protein